MPDGSSSDAPVISQGPMALRYRCHLALVLETFTPRSLGVGSFLGSFFMRHDRRSCQRYQGPVVRRVTATCSFTIIADHLNHCPVSMQEEKIGFPPTRREDAMRIVVRASRRPQLQKASPHSIPARHGSIRSP